MFFIPKKCFQQKISDAGVQAPMKRGWELCDERMPQLSCHEAAHVGDLDALQRARSKGFAWNAGVAEMAAARGHVDCLRYALDHGCARSRLITRAAALGDHVECLRLAISRKCEYDWTTVILAAQRWCTRSTVYLRSLTHACLDPHSRAARKLIAKETAVVVLLPRLRALVRARAIVVYWMQCTAEHTCAPSGINRCRDLAAFVNDFEESL